MQKDFLFGELKGVWVKSNLSNRNAKINEVGGEVKSHPSNGKVGIVGMCNWQVLSHCLLHLPHFPHGFSFKGRQLAPHFPSSFLVFPSYKNRSTARFPSINPLPVYIQQGSSTIVFADKFDRTGVKAKAKAMGKEMRHLSSWIEVAPPLLISPLRLRTSNSPVLETITEDEAEDSNDD